MSASAFGFKRPEDSPGLLLWQTTITWQRLIKNALIEYDISHPQFVIMAILLWFTEKGEDPTQIAIIRLSKLDKMTVSQSLKKLLSLSQKSRCILIKWRGIGQKWFVRPKAMGAMSYLRPHYALIKEISWKIINICILLRTSHPTGMQRRWERASLRFVSIRFLGCFLGSRFFPQCCGFLISLYFCFLRLC